MRKIWAILLTATMVFSLAACGNSGNDTANANSSTQNQASETQTQESVEATSAPEEESTVPKSAPGSNVDETELLMGDFDHEVTQPAPGDGPQTASNITSVAGVPLVQLNNGVYMPRFGFGTQVQSMERDDQRQQLNETVNGMVVSALQSGYRHLDSAMFYYNERGVGWGIKDSGIPREEIWLTSKISGDLANAEEYFEGMLERLQVDYIDLVYIHHPAGTLEDILSAWRVMEKEYKAGRIRALGISNFDNRMDAFNYIMENAEIKPQIAQIECHPLAQRTDARELYANNYDMQVECWYPLNHNRVDVDNAVLHQIADAHGKTVYQVILRWHMQEGLCPVPGSTNPAHILENISIFDFALTDEEMEAIRAIDQGDAGRSFNIPYGDWGFGSFSDYSYEHNYSGSDSEDSTETAGKAIVVYYSGSGNTKRVAQFVADELQADTFEIVPAEPYSDADLNWRDRSSRVNKEHDDASLQDIELVSTEVPNWSEYDVVLFGYPIWWREASWVVNNFIKDNDFTGKTVVPFCTSTSSGLGDSGTNLEKMAGTGTWLEGRRFNEKPDESSVREWVRDLNLE